jgi:hypothetical protein
MILFPFGRHDTLNKSACVKFGECHGKGPRHWIPEAIKLVGVLEINLVLSKYDPSKEAITVFPWNCRDCCAKVRVFDFARLQQSRERTFEGVRIACP